MSDWKPIVKAINWRVEVGAKYDIGNKREAEDVKNEIEHLRGITGVVNCDYEYECPNCHLVENSREGLIGCCEMSEALIEFKPTIRRILTHRSSDKMDFLNVYQCNNCKDLAANLDLLAGCCSVSERSKNEKN